MIQNCSFCGTEIENGGKSCPFCGTPVPKTAENVPAAETEEKPIVPAAVAPIAAEEATTEPVAAFSGVEVAAQVTDEHKFSCVGCGKEYPAGIKFCSECGGKIQEVKPPAPAVFACSGCGKEYPAGIKFCSECGCKVESLQTSAPEVFACSGCGKEYPAGIKFCSECGGKIKAKSSLQSEMNYKTGEGKEKQGEYRSAVDWYKKADSYRAWCRIGHIYQKGFGDVPVNMEEALEAYRKAASMKDENQKDGFAECYLGYFYKSGNCVPRNIVEAEKWFKISAAYGNEYAKKELIRMGC